MTTNFDIFGGNVGIPSQQESKSEIDFRVPETLAEARALSVEEHNQRMAGWQAERLALKQKRQERVVVAMSDRSSTRTHRDSLGHASRRTEAWRRTNRTR